MNGSIHRQARIGHTLVELIVAMFASAFLLAGLGSVMLIARQVAYTPSAAVRRSHSAEVAHTLADELRHATLVLQNTSRLLEFVVADRNADGTAEKIRYEWSGTLSDPLNKTVNGVTSVIAPSVQECQFAVETSTVAGSPVARSYLQRGVVRLRTGAATHSRVDAAIPFLARPELFSAYWRTDFDANPTTVDVAADGTLDWAASNGATFTSGPSAVPGQLANGRWYANGDVATNPTNDFTGITMIETRCQNMLASGNADVLRVNADRQSGVYAPLIVRLQKQADGSQTLTLVGKPTSGTEQSLKVVENLVDDYLRIRLTIQPNTNRVSLQINDVGDDVLGGPFTYPTHAPTSTDRSVKIGGGAKFDYVEVRVLAGS